MLYQLNYCPATYIQRLALFVRCVFPAAGAELLQLHAVRMLAFVARGSIITVFAGLASKDDDVSHFYLPGFLLEDFGNHSAADGVAAFADGEAQSLFHGDGGDQFGIDFHVVAGHDHQHAFRQ